MLSQAKYIVISICMVLLIIFLGFFMVENDATDVKKNDAIYELVSAKEDSGGWSYKIFYRRQLLIKQEYIPAVRGKQLFSSKKDAEKVGKLVIDKLKSNRSPTITIVDLQNYRVKFEE